MKKVYDSIDVLPIYYFHLINKTDDPLTKCKICSSCKESCKYKYLMINEDDDIPKNVNLENLWEKIFDEYINKFGLGDIYNEWLRKKVQAAKLRSQAFMDGQKHLLAIAQVEEMEAEELVKNDIEYDLFDAVIDMTRFLGVRVDPMKTSVTEFKKIQKKMRNGKN